MTHRFVTFVLAAATCFGCSSSDDASGEAPPAATSAAATVTVKSNVFEPATTTVKVGDTVRWTWAGGSHDVVAGDACDPSGLFRSALQTSGSFTHTFDTAGTFDFYCTPHCSMGMKGAIVVTP